MPWGEGKVKASGPHPQGSLHNKATKCNKKSEQFWTVLNSSGQFLLSLLSLPSLALVAWNSSAAFSHLDFLAVGINTRFPDTRKRMQARRSLESMSGSTLLCSSFLTRDIVERQFPVRSSGAVQRIGFLTSQFGGATGTESWEGQCRSPWMHQLHPDFWKEKPIDSDHWL